MAISNPLNGQRKIGTVGKPFPGVEVSTAPPLHHTHTQPITKAGSEIKPMKLKGSNNNRITKNTLG